MVAVEFATEAYRRSLNPVFVCFEGTPVHHKVKDSGMTVVTLNEKDSLVRKVIFFRKVICSYGIGKIIIQKLSNIKMYRFATLGSMDVEILGFSHILLGVKKKDLYHRFLYSRLKKVIAMTEMQKKNIVEYLPIRPEQVYVVPNWVADDRMKNSRGEKIQPKTNKERPPFLGIIASRLDPQKGQDFAIKALDILVREGLDVELWVVGENTKNEMDYGQYLRKLVSDCGLEDRVRFMGYVENVLELVANAHFMIVPSWEETFGRVVIEAMCVGTPVLASNAGGIPEIIRDHENGFLFQTKDVLSLAAAMKEMIQNEALFEKVRNTALLESKKYSQENIMTKLVNEFSWRS